MLKSLVLSLHVVNFRVIFQVCLMSLLGNILVQKLFSFFGNDSMTITGVLSLIELPVRLQRLCETPPPNFH